MEGQKIDFNKNKISLNTLHALKDKMAQDDEEQIYIYFSRYCWDLIILIFFC